MAGGEFYYIQQVKNWKPGGGGGWGPIVVLVAVLLLIVGIIERIHESSSKQGVFWCPCCESAVLVVFHGEALQVGRAP